MPYHAIGYHYYIYKFFNRVDNSFLQRKIINLKSISKNKFSLAGRDSKTYLLLELIRNLYVWATINFTW